MIDSDFSGNINKDYLNEATKKSNTELSKVFKVYDYLKDLLEYINEKNPNLGITKESITNKLWFEKEKDDLKNR